MADPVKRRIEDLRAAGAPALFERNPETLKRLYKAEFERLTGRTLYPAQTEMFLVELAAYVLALLGEAAQTAALQNTVVFSEGVHLENRAANVSTYRLLAQPARTRIRFTLSAARPVNTIVPAGTRVASGNLVTFATDAALVIPAGALSGEADATATEAGAGFNGLEPGTISDLLDPVPYVASAGNVTAVGDGTDVEDEERFRLRVANALHTIAKSGPRNGYREHVMAVDPEIVDVDVHRPAPGCIEIYPLMRTGQPGPELMAAVLAYLDPETLRPMGDAVSVLAPARVGFDLALTVRTLSASAGLEDAVRNAALAAFEPWTQQLGAQIAPSVLIAAVKAVAGVVDVSVGGLAFTDLPHASYAGLDDVSVNIVVVPNA